VVFIQGILVEGLRFLGDWRMILFGVLIILSMNFKPDGLFDNQSLRLIKQSLRFKS
jgi:branched-chain amino acid transport system permease protein